LLGEVLLETPKTYKKGREDSKLELEIVEFKLLLIPYLFYTIWIVLRLK